VFDDWNFDWCFNCFIPLVTRRIWPLNKTIPNIGLYKGIKQHQMITALDEICGAPDGLTTIQHQLRCRHKCEVVGTSKQSKRLRLCVCRVAGESDRNVMEHCNVSSSNPYTQVFSHLAFLCRTRGIFLKISWIWQGISSAFCECESFIWYVWKAAIFIPVKVTVQKRASQRVWLGISAGNWNPSKYPTSNYRIGPIPEQFRENKEKHVYIEDE